MPGTGGKRYKERSRSYLAKIGKKLSFEKTLAKAKSKAKSVEVNAETEPKAKKKRAPEIKG